MNKRFIGRKKTKEEIEKIRNAQLGKPRPYTTGSKNGLWKGDNVSYAGLHKYIERYFVKPSFCEICQKPVAKKGFNWSSTEHTYTRIRSDWRYLCLRCHSLYDIRHLNKKIGILKDNPNNTKQHRQCSTCRQILPLTTRFFHRSNGHTFGFKYVCRECRSQQAKKLYQKLL